MKLKKYKSYCVLLTVIIFFTTFQSSGQWRKHISISNTLKISRPDELIVLKRADIEKQAGGIPNHIQVTSNGKDLVVQHDDLNGDNIWDEAVLLYSFKPNERVNFTITPVEKSHNVYAGPRANVALGKKTTEGNWSDLIQEEMPFNNPATDFEKQRLPLYKAEGPGWENDKVGFRLYFDMRNGKDIWGKLTPNIVLDTVGAKGNSNYHSLNAWGMDILKVGKSLGAGSLAMIIPLSEKKDTLIRLGGKDVYRTFYKQLSDGPVRACFQISYNWKINNHLVNIVEQISIWGGQYFYESQVWVKGTPAGSKLVTGIANLYETTFQTFQVNNSNVLLTHGQQSENKDYLGMAIITRSKNFSHVTSAPITNSDILNTYLVVQDITNALPAKFRFVAAWEKSDPRFLHFNSYKKFIEEEALKMNKGLSFIW